MIKDFQTIAFRRSNQPVLPIKSDIGNTGEYNPYPLHQIAAGDIFIGYTSLCKYLAKFKTIRIDGFSGVLWTEVISRLENDLKAMGLNVGWTFTDTFYRTEEEIQFLRKLFLGEKGSVWGKQADINLSDLFNTAEIAAAKPDQEYDINICIGIGAALFNWDGPLVYLEVPKNEIQYRMRAGAIGNLATNQKTSYEEQYKSLYFIDWPIFRAHREAFFDSIEVFADTQWPDDISWMFTKDLKTAIDEITASPFRVRPWFEKGVWGGQYLKHFVPGLSQQEENYAWSFELIVPENGIILHQNGNNLEIPFDLLMFRNSQNVLGKHEKIFGTEFPIRFDFLDTIKGGNLSVQVHPGFDYIRKNFGETITQDETYYILDCDEEASVYLGLQEGTIEQDFKAAADKSYNSGNTMDIEKYVQRIPAKKHDLFLIPNGTVHSAGRGNLVLEISATPYIFTFKIYDWLRPDLNGKPRPISIDHAFKNIDFSLAGSTVTEKLIAQPRLLTGGIDWEIYHLATHEKHFYDVQRLHIGSKLDGTTAGICKVLMVVEGDGVILQANEKSLTFQYAETFVIPAATGNYQLSTTNGKPIKVIEAFLKPAHSIFEILLNDKIFKHEHQTAH